MATNWAACLATFHIAQGIYAPDWHSPETIAGYASAKEKLLAANHCRSLEEGAQRYDQFAQEYGYFLLDPLYVESMGRFLVEIAKLLEQRRVARVHEAGCGVGLDLAFLASHFPEVYFTASDISQGMLRIAQSRLWMLRLSNVTLAQAAHEHLSPELTGGHVDACLVMGSFMYRGLSEMVHRLVGLASIVKSRGMLFIVMPSTLHVEEIARYAWMVNLRVEGILADPGNPDAIALAVIVKESEVDDQLVGLRLIHATQQYDW